MLAIFRRSSNVFSSVFSVQYTIYRFLEVRVLKESIVFVRGT